METKLELPPDKLTYRAESLTRNHKYSFRVGAATLVGDGETTHSVTATTVDNGKSNYTSYLHIRIQTLLAFGMHDMNCIWCQKCNPN